MKMNGYVLPAAAALGVFAMQAPAGIIASDNFGGSLQPQVYGTGFMPNSGSGSWSANWYAGRVKVENSNLSHGLSVVPATGYSIGSSDGEIANARRDFTATSNPSYSFLSRGPVLFDINTVSNPKPIDITYSVDSNGKLDGRITYWHQNNGWSDTGTFDLPHNITAAQTIMTLVQVTPTAANIWFLHPYHSSYDINTPDVSLSGILSQNYERVVALTFPDENYSGQMDGVVIATSINDIAPMVTPTPGAVSALVGAGILAMGNRRRGAR